MQKVTCGSDLRHLLPWWPAHAALLATMVGWQQRPLAEAQRGWKRLSSHSWCWIHAENLAEPHGEPSNQIPGACEGMCSQPPPCKAAWTNHWLM